MKIFWIVGAILTAGTAHALEASFTIPAWSAVGCSTLVGVPARVKYVRAWVRPAAGYQFIRVYGLNYPVAGRMDGRKLRLPINPTLCLEGCEIRVAVGDSSLNWSGKGCGGDASIMVDR